MRSILPLLTCLALAACQSTPEAGSAGTSGAATEADLPDPSMIEDVSVGGTVDLLSGGIGRVSPSVAIQTIDLWLVRLDTVSLGGVAEVRDDLDELRDLLQSSPLDGRAIGLTLKRLGSSADSLSAQAAGLAPLASTLRSAGRRLAPDSTEADADAASVQ